MRGASTLRIFRQTKLAIKTDSRKSVGLQNVFAPEDFKALTKNFFIDRKRRLCRRTFAMVQHHVAVTVRLSRKGGEFLVNKENLGQCFKIMPLWRWFYGFALLRMPEIYDICI